MDCIGTKDLTVVSRDGERKGKTTGGTRRCQMEGCLGRRPGVRWANKKITFPCTKGMVWDGERWKIL